MTRNDASVLTLGTLHRVLFEELLHSDLPARDKTEERQLNTAQLLISAGFETTAFTLETAFFHLLSNPLMLRQLQKELADAYPDLEMSMTWTRLEKLPYLSAVISESLRMSLGVMSRLPRINAHEDMVFNNWVIPKGTSVGMSIRFMHYNPDIFAEPLKFDPGRWLQGEKSEHLKKFLVPFSRGARVCLGKE